MEKTQRKIIVEKVENNGLTFGVISPDTSGCYDCHKESCENCDEWRYPEYEGVMCIPQVIDDKTEELRQRVWFMKHWTILDDGTIIPDSPDHALEFEKIRDKFGEKTLLLHSAFEWGVLCGQLSALRWVRGMDWDYTTE